MQDTSSSQAEPTWLQLFWRDLQPTPGRLHSTLRIVLATVVALILLQVWRMPFASIGLYFIFLVGRDSPAVSLRTSFVSFLTVLFAVVVELAVVIVSDNDPVARLLSVTVVTFLAGLLVASLSVPTLGSSWGLIYCTVIALWEGHGPADTTVKNSLWLLATFALSVGCAVVVEYVFGVRDPVEKLKEQRHIRYEAIERMFSLFGQGADARERSEAATRVGRLAVAGGYGMMELYNAIVERNLNTGALPIGMRVRITMLAELMDFSAAFGLQNKSNDDPEIRRRCARIAELCHEMTPTLIVRTEKMSQFKPGTAGLLLDRVETTLYSILMMPIDFDGTKNRELVALPAKRVPFFIPGAIRTRESVAFAMKISFCATLCYIIYHAVDWPGISTAVITVMVAGLSSSGATNQRLTFRLVGSAIGGLVLGLGATAFLFPYMDSITSLVVVVGSVAFAAAWIGAGAKFNYIGLQMAFAFYLVAFEGFSAPTQLAPARDRLIGILLALGVMWFVFDQLWPVRTVTVMRQTLAAVLRSVVSLFQIAEKHEYRTEQFAETETLRDRVGKNVAGLRTLRETVDYEFGVDREQHKRLSELILNAGIVAAALFWNQLTILHNERDSDFLARPDLLELRTKIAAQLNLIAEAVVRRTSFPTIQAQELLSAELLADPRHVEYAQNTVARYSELQSLVSQLAQV